jgi:hypothetical protein
MVSKGGLYLRQLALILLGLSSANLLIGFKLGDESVQLEDRNRHKTSLRVSYGHFLPEKILQQYISWHGVDALRRCPHDRQFAVVCYNCPHRAGNALHSFFNMMIWAIALNRTMLWRYDNRAARNTVDYCDQFLERAAWIPSYDEWSAKLSLPAPMPIKINTYWNLDHSRRRNATYHLFSHEEQRQSLNELVVTPPRFRDFVPADDFDTSRVHWNDDPRKLTAMTNFFSYWYYGRGPHTDSKRTRRIMRALYTEGLPYLYGMLFRHSLRILQSNNSSLEGPIPLNAGVSIALHSRHSHEEWNGTDVSDEIHCLSKMLASLGVSTRGRQCTVYLMSDRQVTLDILRDWLREYGCRSVTAHHSRTIHPEFGWKPEMGSTGGPVSRSLLSSHNLL